METARAALRVQNAQSLAAAHEKRNELVREAFSARGESVPELDSSSGASPVTASNVKAPDTGADAFKERMVTEVESLLPPVEDAGPGRRLAADLLRDSVNNVPLADEQGQADMSARLIAGVAKQAGVGWEEMEKLMELVEKDEGKRKELRKVVKEAMFKEEQRVQDGAQQTGT